MWSPFDVARQAEVMTSYKPIPYNIVGFDYPVTMISELAQPSGSHVYIPIPWDAECVNLRMGISTWMEVEFHLSAQGASQDGCSTEGDAQCDV
eukprot:3979237-Amphidinium_carterae.1